MRRLLSLRALAKETLNKPVTPANAGVQTLAYTGFRLLPPSRSENPRRVETAGMTNFDSISIFLSYSAKETLIKVVTPAQAGVQALETLDSGFRRNDGFGLV